MESSIAHLERRGVAIEDLLDAEKTARKNSGRFQSIGQAIGFWCRSGAWPARGVVPWQHLQQAACRASETADLARRRQAAAEREAQELRAELMDLERRFGADLDRLPADALRSLVDHLHWSDFQRESFRRNPRGMCRTDLLQAFAAMEVGR